MKDLFKNLIKLTDKREKTSLLSASQRHCGPIGLWQGVHRMPENKIAEDYKFFRDHFYPEKEPESTPAAKPCPTCGCKIHKIIDGKRVCEHCGNEISQ